MEVIGKVNMKLFYQQRSPKCVIRELNTAFVATKNTEDPIRKQTSNDFQDLPRGDYVRFFLEVIWGVQKPPNLGMSWS